MIAHKVVITILLYFFYFQGRVLYLQHGQQLSATGVAPRLETAKVPLRQRTNGHADALCRADHRGVASVSPQSINIVIEFIHFYSL